MEKNILRKLNCLKYKISCPNVNFNNLDLDCIFIGDIYRVKYKEIFSWGDSFEKATQKNLIMKDAILLRVGFEKYINLSDIITKKDEEKAIEKLRNLTKKSSEFILGEYYKPDINDYIVSNIRNFNELSEVRKIGAISLRQLHFMQNSNCLDFNELPRNLDGKAKLKVLSIFKK